MAEICVFCKKQIESPYPPRLEEIKMFMFELLMEQTFFDTDSLINSPMCEDCDETTTNFFNFKSKFMETEDELINYMDSNKKVDLYKVLVKTFKLVKFEDENVQIRVCRICFKATQLEDYKEIKSLENKMLIKVTTCLPEFHIKLTDHTYLCPECCTVIPQYHNFLLLCLETTKLRKKISPNTFDSLSKKRPSSEIVDKDSLSKLVDKEEINLKVSSALSEKKTILMTDCLSSKEAGSEGSDPWAKKTAVLKTSDSPPGKRGISEALMSDPLAISGEPIDKKRKVDNNMSDEEAISQPLRRSRRPRAKRINTGPTTMAKFELKWLTESPAAQANVQYECQMCPEILHNFQNLKGHIEAHQKDPNYFCWQCGYKCHNFWAMYRHFEKHGTDLFKMINNDSNDGDTAGELSKISGNNQKGTLSAIDKTDIDGDLLYVKHTEIYKPPGVKKPRKKRGKKEIIVVPRHNSKNGNKYFQCQICQKIINSILGWPDHIAFHRNKGSIGCWRCGEWFESLDLLREHFFVAHFIATFYKLVSNNIVQSWARKRVTLVADIDIQWDKLSPLSSTISVPCMQCNEIVKHDTYMDHVCKVRPNKLPLLKSGKSQISTSNSPPHQTESTTKNPSDDYECFYCLETFNTITGLSNHICQEDLESTVPEITANTGNVASKNTSPVRTCEAVAVKEEALFQCSYCGFLFESGLELDQHKCSNASANVEVSSAVSVNTDNILDNIEDMSAGDNVSLLIKADPECYDSFRPTYSGVEIKTENYDNVQCNTKVSDGETVSKNTDDVLRSRNVVNLLETPERAKMNKQNAINKKVSMCIGCGFTSIDQKDFMSHIGFCDKIFTIFRQQEVHGSGVNNIMIFVCPLCTFVTSMKEKYIAHILTHQENCQNDNVQCLSDVTKKQPMNLQSMSNEMVNFKKFKDGRVSISEKISHLTNQKKKSRGQQHAAGSGNQKNVVEVTKNIPQATVTSTRQNEISPPSLSDEDTLSAENLWPVDSDDDSEECRIPRPDPIDNRGDRINGKNPLGWLVKSSLVDENGANRQTEVGVEASEERSYRYNLSELVPEQTSFKSEPLEDPL